VIDDSDLEIVSGCLAAHPNQRGGQHVAMSCSGVLVIHRPSGIAVRVLDERSQIRNKTVAIAKLTSVLRAIDWFEDERTP
jgi:protein subunit release factor A